MKDYITKHLVLFSLLSSLFTFDTNSIKNRIRTVFFFLFLFLPICFSYGQFSKEHTSKFGEVSLEEVQMKQHDTFPEADAIILFETCRVTTKVEKVEVRNGTDYRFVTYKDIHKRIKILNKTGLDNGNISIYYTEERHLYNSRRGQDITDIKASTYLEKNGKIEEYKLLKSDIYEKNIVDRSNNDFKEITFALPNVKEGSVIEYSYTIELTGISDDWTFQHSLPTLWSEYLGSIPKAIGITPIHKGIYKYQISEETTGEVFDSGEGFATREIRLAVKNIAPFKKESYMSAAKDHVQSFTVEYNSLQYDFMEAPYYFTTGFLKTAHHLLTMREEFGEQLKKGRHIRPILDTLIRSGMTSIEKMAAIHKFVLDNFEHNNEFGIFTKGIRRTLNEKSGSAADLNFVMLLMLQEANLFAEPLLLSTRENGKVTPYQRPYLEKFDYMAVYVLDDQNHYFLDATQNHLPTGLLPFHCYNGQAWVVNKDVIKWFDVSDGVTQKESTKTVLKLDKKGNLRGTMRITSHDHLKRRIADQLEAKNKEDYIKERIENGELEVESFEFDGLEQLQEPVSLTLQIKNKSAAATANLLYFTPVLSSLFDDNPFKNPERTYPVDFGTAQTHTYMMVLEIPENYKVDEMPQSIIYDLLEGKAAYSYSISQKGNKIIVRCRTQINEKTFSPKEYMALRGFINQILSKQEEQLVLKRIDN